MTNDAASIHAALVEMAQGLDSSYLSDVVQGKSVYTVDELTEAGLDIRPELVPIIELPDGTKVVPRLMVKLGDDCKPAGLQDGVAEVSRIIDPSEDLIGALDWWYHPNAWSTGRVWSSKLQMHLDVDPGCTPVLLLGTLTVDEMRLLAEHELPED